MQRGVVLTVVSAAVVLFGVGSAMAQPPRACVGDVEKLCKDTPAGAGRILACLQVHSSQLSSECQQALETKRMHAERRRTPGAARNNWVTPCMGDVEKLCKGIPAGAGRIAECLHQHQAELSDACKAAFPGKPAPAQEKPASGDQAK